MSGMEFLAFAAAYLLVGSVLGIAVWQWAAAGFGGASARVDFLDVVFVCAVALFWPVAVVSLVPALLFRMYLRWRERT